MPKSITASGQIETFRLKVVDDLQRWFMVSAVVSAKECSGDTLTALSGTAVNLNVAEDVGRREPVNIEVLARLEDYTCTVRDDAKLYTLHLAIPVGEINANLLTDICGRPATIVIEQAQAELPFGGSPTAKAQARGKSTGRGRGKGKDNKTEELGV